jgi:hypothetical protein
VAFEILMPDRTPAPTVNVQYGKLDARDRADADSKLAMAHLNTSTSLAGAKDYLTLSPGFYAFEMELAAESSLVSGARLLVHAGEGGDQHVTVRMRQVPGVVIKVKDESGVGLGHSLDFYCIPWTGESPPTYRELRNFQRTITSSRTYGRKWLHDADSTLVLKNLEPGRHVATLEAGGRVVAHTFFVPNDSAQEIVLVIPPPARDEYIMVWIREPSGELVRNGVGFSIEAQWKNSHSSRSGSGRVTPEGWWRLPHMPQGDGPGEGVQAVWTVTASHDQWGRISATLVPGPANELSLQFLEAASLEVVVDGLATHPAKAHLGAMMVPAEGNDEVRGNATFLTGLPSGYSAASLQPGKYRVTLTLEVGDHGRIELASQEITLASGRNTMRLQIPALYSLTIHVPSSDAGRTVWLSQSEASGGAEVPARRRYGVTILRETNQQKQAVFEFLPVGRYTVNVSSNGTESYPSQEVSLPGPALVTMHPKQ